MRVFACLAALSAVHRETAGALGLDAGLPVVVGSDLDVDATRVAGLVNVLDLSIGDLHVPLVVTGQVQLVGRFPPGAVGFFLALPGAGGFAAFRQDAFQLGVDQDAPEPGSLSR